MHMCRKVEKDISKEVSCTRQPHNLLIAAVMLIHKHQLTDWLVLKCYINSWSSNVYASEWSCSMLILMRGESISSMKSKKSQDYIYRVFSLQQWYMICYMQQANVYLLDKLTRFVNCWPQTNPIHSDTALHTAAFQCTLPNHTNINQIYSIYLQ